jgi:uncharacterized membrane protein YbhN (UPF0104 family)
MLRLLRSTWFRLLVTAGILAYLASTFDMRQAAAAMVSVNLAWFLLTLALVAVDRLVMAVRWLMLLRASDVKVSFGQAVRIFLISSFVGSVLPAGIGADASRAYALAVHTSQGHEAVASVAVDRVLGMVALPVLGLIGLALWAGHADQTVAHVAWALGALVVASLAALLWIDRALQLAMPRGWQRSGWGRRVLDLGEAIGRYRGRGRILLAVFLLSTGVQVVRVLQAYCLGRGLGIDVAFAYYLVFMPVGLLMLLLPISISGFGLPQGVIVWLLRPVGVADAQSFALSTLILIVALVGNLPGAWLYLRRPQPGSRRTVRLRARW